MSDTPQHEARPKVQHELRHEPPQHPHRENHRLLWRVLLYHVVLAIFVISLALVFPDFIAELPIGGVTELAEEGDISVSSVDAPPSTPAADLEIVETVLRATSELDRLGYARQLVFVLIGVWLVMLPVSWVHKGIHRVSTYDHSLDETTLILPGVVAAIVLGGVSLAGGVGNLLGALIGVLIFGLIQNGLGLLGVGTQYQLVITGAIIILAVAIDELKKRHV
jgi:hypothetical protein